MMAPGIAKTNSFSTATGDGRVGHVDVRDVAAVAAKIAASPSAHAGKTYWPTGPEVLSGTEVLSKVLGRGQRHSGRPDGRRRLRLPHRRRARSPRQGRPQLRTIRQRLRRSVLVSPNSHLEGEVIKNGRVPPPVGTKNWRLAPPPRTDPYPSTKRSPLTQLTEQPCCVRAMSRVSNRHAIAGVHRRYEPSPFEQMAPSIRSRPLRRASVGTHHLACSWVGEFGGPPVPMAQQDRDRGDKEGEEGFVKQYSAEVPVAEPRPG